jgi:mono/diheme cytochrome c family protein
MQSKTLRKLLTIFFVLVIFSSCSRDNIVPDPPAPPAPPPDSTESQISYSGEIQPIFTANCVKCHATGKVAPTLSEGKSYQSLMNTAGMIDVAAPGNSKLYQEMQPGGGMSSFCTKANSDSTYKWIRQGAKNN